MRLKKASDPVRLLGEMKGRAKAPGTSPLDEPPLGTAENSSFWNAIALHEMSSIFRHPVRPLIEIDAHERVLEKAFPRAFGEACSIINKAARMAIALSLEFYDAHTTSLNVIRNGSQEDLPEGPHEIIALIHSFQRVCESIRESADSPRTATLAFVELFNYLAEYEVATKESGFIFSILLLEELSHVEGVDLCIFDEAVLCFWSDRHIDSLPVDIMWEWPAFLRLLDEKARDLNSGDAQRAAKAEAWMRFFEMQESEISDLRR